MTASEAKIAKKILDVLHDLDGGQAHPLTIHAEMGGLSMATGGEFDNVLAILDGKRWINGVKTELKGTLWNITPLGESKRNQF